MKTLTLSFLFALTLSLQAEVVIYKQAISDTATGNGRVLNRTYAGWLLFDTDSYEVRDILARKLNTKTTPKTFVQIGSGADVRLLSAGANKFVLWAAIPLYDSGGAMFKGAATIMTLGTSNAFYVPKSLAVKGASFEDASNSLHEFTGTLTLDSKASIAANQAGRGIDTVAEKFIQGLSEQGYSEL